MYGLNCRLKTLIGLLTKHNCFIQLDFLYVSWVTPNVIKVSMNDMAASDVNGYRDRKRS